MSDTRTCTACGRTIPGTAAFCPEYGPDAGGRCPVFAAAGRPPAEEASTVPVPPRPAEAVTATYPTAPPPRYAVPQVARPGNPWAALLAFAGGALCIAGALLPWLRSDPGGSVSGLDASDDAKIAIALGAAAVVIGVALLVKLVPLLMKILLLGTAAGAGAVAVIDLVDIFGFDDVEVGAGLFVIAGGAVVLALAALLTRTKRIADS